MKKCTLFHLCVLVAMTILVTACGGTEPSSPSSKSTVVVPTVDSNAPKGYMDSEPSYVMFVQWTEKNGQMSGQLEQVYVNSENTMQVKQLNEAFTGTHDGSNISMSMSMLGITKTFTGTLNNDTLTLVVPRQDGTLSTLTLHPASVDDYNKAATTLTQNVNQQAAQATATTQTQQINAQNAQATAVAQNVTATAQANLHQAVADANNVLHQDFQYLNQDRQVLQQEQDLSNDIKPYDSGIKTMQKDLATEQADASGGCSNYSEVGSDETEVGSDETEIGSDDTEFQSSYQHVASDIDLVKQRIATTQDDWKKLQDAVAADAPGGLDAAYSQQDLNNEVHSTQGQITVTKNAIDAQASTVTSYDNKAKQIYQKAQDVYNGMHC